MKRICPILVIKFHLSGKFLNAKIDCWKINSERSIRIDYYFFFLFLRKTKRAAQKNDLVMPDEARAVAKELGIAYYETSVFTYFGVNEVFENAIRAALIQRRHQRFWMTNLKRVKRPLLQVKCDTSKPFR